MAVNPMQRKVRNSFLLGVLVTLLIAIIIIALLFMQIKNLNDEKAKTDKEQKTKMVLAYVLTTDVKSGGIIYDGNENNFIVQKQVESSIIQSELLSAQDLTTFVESLGVDVNNTLVSKLDLPANTIITKNMVSKSNEIITSDVRKMEYNMFILPSQLEPGDYIDIRLSLPTGEDLIVISKKMVLDTNSSTIWINATEDEIQTISNAIVDAYVLDGSKLYVTQYVEAGTQNKSNITYTPSENTRQLINNSSDIVQTAKAELAARWQNSVRDVIDSNINAQQMDTSEKLEKVNEGVIEEATNLKEARQEFLGEIED